MLETSTVYKTAITASARTNFFKASFGFTPPGAAENATLSASGEAEWSRLPQVNDGVSEFSKKWGTLELNRWVLDDSMTIIDPDDETAQVGWWSAVMSGEDGSFSSPPFIEYDLDKPYDLIGLTLNFDNPCGEWPTNLTVEYYDSKGSPLNTISIEPTEPMVLVDTAQQGVKTIKVLFNEWCLPHRRAKVVEILPGQIFVFDDSNTNSFQLIEPVSFFSNSFDSPEFQIEFVNENGQFDMLNPKGIFAYLSKNMKMTAEIGTELADGSIEWVSVGEFFLYEIPGDQQTDTVKFVCRPAIALYDDLTYPTENKERTTVADVVDTIFQTIGMTDGYSVDSTLQKIEVNGYCGDDVKISDAFAMIATAAAGYWKINRDGTYELLPIPTSFASESAAALDYDSVLEKPQISSNRTTSVKVTGNFFKTISATEGYTDWTGFDVSVAADVDDGNSVNISSAFIAGRSVAQDVAEKALAFYSHELTFSSDYRGDPALQAGDMAEVETDYGKMAGIVEELTLTFDNRSFLSGETVKGRGAAALSES